MKKKTIFTISIAAAAVIALLLICLPLLSQWFSGRSWNATMFAWQFRKEAYTTEEAFADYLDAKRAEHEAPYDAPDNRELLVSVDKDSAGDMDYFVLNRQDAPQRALVYFAGGSYADDPRPVHWQFLDALAHETGLMILVPLYPKLPEADAGTSYAALMDFYGEAVAPLAPEELLFMGDSAGGGMALSFAMQLRDAGLEGPEELLLLCPWLDVTLTNPDIPAYEKKDPALDSEQLRHLGDLWAGDLDPADPVVSPLYGDLSGLGHITLVTTTGELLYPDILRLDQRLTDAGIEHTLNVRENMFHVWPLYFYYRIPEAVEDTLWIEDQLR